MRLTRFLLPAFLLWAICARVAAEAQPMSPVGPDSRIEIVYSGAKDCPACLGWKREGGGRELFMRFAESRHVVFREIEKATLDAPFSDSEWPEDLRWLPKGNPKLYDIVPAFSVLVDGRLVMTRFGTVGWGGEVVPAVRALVRDKLDAP